MTKIIVAGSRNFMVKDFVFKKLDEIIKGYKNVEIVEGGAKGVDYLAKQYAIEHNIPCKEFPANWNLYGRSAGILRNKDMASYSDVLIAFYNGSRGTSNMIKGAKDKGLDIYIVEI